jgi:hypothetical protein
VKSLAKNKQGKSWFDASFGELFRQIAYKSLWDSKHFVRVDRLPRPCAPPVDKITTFVCRIGNGNVPAVAHSRLEISTPPSTSEGKVYGCSLRDAQRVETPMDHM